MTPKAETPPVVEELSRLLAWMEHQSGTQPVMWVLAIITDLERIAEELRIAVQDKYELVDRDDILAIAAQLAAARREG